MLVHGGHYAQVANVILLRAQDFLQSEAALLAPERWLDEALRYGRIGRGVLAFALYNIGLEAALPQIGMEAFAENIITEGVSNLALLRSLEERDVNEIMDEQGMQRMQKRVFKREWFRLKESPPQKFMA